MKMYILVKETVPLGLAVNAVGHASLSCYLDYEKDEVTQQWLKESFKKVTCVVSEQEFEEAKGRSEEKTIITESDYDNNEVAIAFKPRNKFDKYFKKFKLYGA